MAIALSGKIISGMTKTHVLGASTSILLADKGSDDSGTTSGSGGGGTSGSGDSSISGGGSLGDSSTPGTSGSSDIAATTGTTSVSGDTKVDCVGPDGKHFTTSYHDCQELNQKWGRSSFSFTPLNSTSTENKAEVETQTEIPDQNNIAETHHTSLDIVSKGLKVKIKREDNGSLSITTEKEDGQESKLKDSALSDVNDALSEQDVEVGTTSANELAITSHHVSAHTVFPISIDPSTNVLSITTPAGTKDVTVLPDQAIKGILGSKMLTNILSQSGTDATGSASTNTVIGLTTLNNEPVFEVQGVKEKHLLGVFPVAFPKTVTISAQTGQVLSTQESLINQILEAISL